MLSARKDHPGRGLPVAMMVLISLLPLKTFSSYDQDTTIICMRRVPDGSLRASTCCVSITPYKASTQPLTTHIPVSWDRSRKHAESYRNASPDVESCQKRGWRTAVEFTGLGPRDEAVVATSNPTRNNTGIIGHCDSSSSILRNP